MQPQTQVTPKVVMSGPAARQKALQGIDTVYEAVSATLGPRSANVGITRPFGRPSVVHDGVTVAKEILPLADPFENYGAELAVEAADRTNAIGDGTTTSTVLMREISKRANAAIVAGAKPMALRAGIEAAAAAVAEYLTSQAKPIEGKDTKANVENVRRIATISAQNEEIGGMVADAYEALGKDGILSVEEASGDDTRLEIKTGMEIDRGYRSPFFVTDAKTGEASIKDCHVLVTDYDVLSVELLAPICEGLVAQGVKSLLLVANDIDGEALAFLIVNHKKGLLRSIAVQAPNFGDRRQELLKDIAVATGATLISEKTGLAFSSDGITPALLGTAKRVTATKDYTLIVEAGGAQEDIDERAKLIKDQADNADTSAFDREKLLERYAKFKSGVGVLRIGAKSEPEIKERKERAIDAISAAKAALDGGILPGGGTALLEAAKNAKIDNDMVTAGGVDFAAGVRIVHEACAAPFRKLLENSGFDAGAYINQVGKGKGFDVISGQVVDMAEVGIIDPVMVVRAALENATTNAVMVATTNVIITEKPAEASK